jgi:hypothetical protein
METHVIDDDTRAALEIHLAVQLAVMPASRFRALAKPHGADDARKALARDLAASLAAPFNVTPRTGRDASFSTHGPSDGRTSWAE